MSRKPQRSAYTRIQSAYPICLTRELSAARAWLRRQARGTERFGLVASSGAQRLRPEGIHIKAEIEPANWFLNNSNDVRSCCYLEDVASEFAVQGLELDWVGVCWDGDFHHNHRKWVHQAFKGTRWQSVNDESRRLYLRNAYRVILTRARQGMIIFVPRSSPSDHTRPSSFYDGTFEYLRSCGIPVLGKPAGPSSLPPNGHCVLFGCEPDASPSGYIDAELAHSPTLLFHIHWPFHLNRPFRFHAARCCDRIDLDHRHQRIATVLRNADWPRGSTALC